MTHLPKINSAAGKFELDTINPFPTKNKPDKNANNKPEGDDSLILLIL